MNAFLNLLFPALLCLMALLGYLVFYLESQQYAAREVVLRGLRWHSLACVLAALLLVAGQSFVGAAQTKDGREAELPRLRERLATLEAEKLTLLGDLTLADAARVKAEYAVKEAALVRETLVAQHDAAMVEVASNRLGDEMAKAKGAEVQTIDVAVEMKPTSDDIVAGLQRVSRSLGDSINPAYRPDSPAKRAANSLIQQALQRLGSYHGELNADGRSTAEAVRAYQSAKALPQTGIVASRTVRAIAEDFEELYAVAAMMSVDGLD